MTTVRLREFEDPDFEAMAEIASISSPRADMSAEAMRFEDSKREDKYFRKRFMAERDGKPVGYAIYSNMVWMYHPDKYFVQVRVLPEDRRAGIGAMLWDAVVRDIEPRKPVSLFAFVEEDEPAGLRFAAKHEFVEAMRDWESVLDVASCDLSKIEDPARKLLGEGIVIKSLAQLRQEDPDCLRRVHALDMAASADVPSPDEFTPFDFEYYCNSMLEHPQFLPEAFFVAVDGDKYVGMSVLWKRAKGNALGTGLTGVLREYRRRGIALALKLAAVRYAKSVGVQKIHTENATTNRGMLSINELLGFEKQPATVHFVKKLREMEEAKSE